MDRASVARRGFLWMGAAAVVLSAPGSERLPGTGTGPSAVVIGDSQTGAGTWVDRGLAELGYRTVLRGAGGTGYTKASGTTGRYHDALTRKEWLLPEGKPELVVLQGGGNDVGYASDQELVRAAEEMITEMRQTYPLSRLVMVGVISSGPGPGPGGSRHAADRLLASVAGDQGVEFLAVGDWWTRFGLNQFLQPDGRHFTPAGHRAAGRVFARELGFLLAAGAAGPGEPGGP